MLLRAAGLFCGDDYNANISVIWDRCVAFFKESLIPFLHGHKLTLEKRMSIIQNPKDIPL